MPTIHRRFPSALSALCLAVLLPSIASAQASRDSTFALPRNAVVDITMRTGRLVVRGTDRTTADVRANDRRFDLRSTGVGVTLAMRDDRGRYDDDRRGARDGRDAAVELEVPTGVRLVISAGTADVDVENITGDVEVHSLSGDIVLRSIGGRTIVETLSGDLQLTGGAGGVRATTMSGDIVLRGVRGTASVHTTSGEVALSMLRAAEVEVESVSGDIGFEGDVTDDARLQLTTHSGDVTIRIPESGRGVIEMSTFNGDMTSDRALTLLPGAGAQGKRSDRGTQRFEFGGGGATRITVSTFSGDIHVGRGARRPPE